MADQPDLDQLSAYERRAWNETSKRLVQPPRRLPVPERARQVSRRAGASVARFSDERLPVEQVKSIVTKAMDGTFEMTFKPALRSANLDTTVEAICARHPDIGTAADLAGLDLEDLDRFRRRKGAYVTASATQGAATSLAVTGGVVSTTVTAGVSAGVAVGAVAADTVATLAMMGRTVGSVAVRYGYDVRLPDEELYAVSVLSAGVASGAEARVAALTSLSKLTQDMMRKATWKQLDKHVLVKVIRRVYELLGLRLTQRKLAQVVPIVGVGINAGLNAYLTKEVYQRAEDVYRLRFLTDKYDLDPSMWLALSADSQSPDGEWESDEVIDVEQILHEVEAEGVLGDDDPGPSRDRDEDAPT